MGNGLNQSQETAAACLHQKRNPAYTFRTNVTRWQSTDAISVACKQLGIGADVYWDSDRTKYNKQNNPDLINESDINEIFLELKRTGIGIKNVLSKYGLTDIHDMTNSQANETTKKAERTSR